MTSLDQLLITSRAILGSAQVTENVADTTARIIGALWESVDPYDEKSVANFVEQAGGIIVGSQRSVATAATASQLMQLRAVGINQNVPVTIPDSVRGHSVTFGAKKVTVHAGTSDVEYLQTESTVERTVTKADAVPDQIFQRAAVAYRYEKSLGADDSQAAGSARKKIADIVDGNLILAQRLAEQQTLSAVRDLDKRVVGYRRVIHPELSKGGVCGLCIAASSRKYKISTLRPIHNRCACSITAITDQHDVGNLLNNEDLDKLYDQAGESTYGKDLKKTRFELVDHNELGPVLTRIGGEKVPYYSTQRPGPAAKPAESESDKAKRLLPGLEDSLSTLLARGFAEDSSPVVYHLTQIARLRKVLA